ncbi:FliM/FliN family flagellar motor switch protein [Fulvimarina sp. 2208YS6-2-32]|uniref:Flagellar motor switch protein FliM n=1 Tax=Fulvimarina uroteuthidis TaxID=3098149 RepID=A0ABU5I0S1_9HYPH|nr:FliM/FliN family flagellar motor switch protein [Fulvimarina sp. 2208YS6-2-32]MDY8108920.1 FliM/FliN family flagellar motor switch protein [Fulvimarina sp. 2208YS6-2-32]
MSDTIQSNDPSTISARLKTAAEIDPGKLLRLRSIVDDMAEELTLALGRLSVEKMIVAFREFEVGLGPDADDEAQADRIVLAIESRRFARSSYVSAPKSLADTCILAFFGAAPLEAQDSRELTELDRALVRETFEAVVTSFGTAFQAIDDPEIQLGPFVLPEAFEERFGGPKAPQYLALTFDLWPASARASLRPGAESEGEPLSSVTFALPMSYVTPHRRKLSEPVPMPEPSPDESWSEAMVRNFEKSGLHLEAVLARKQVPLSLVAHLRVGQTLSLDVGVNDPLTLECEGKPIFKAQVGFARGSYVTRFDSAIDPTQEFIDDILSD